MKGYLVPTFCTVLLLSGLNASEAMGQAATAEAHVAAARAAAYAPGQDFTWIFDGLCAEPSPPRPAPAARPANPTPTERTIPPRADWYESPVQLFDNLYYVGSYLQSMWAVTTSEGIILHDTAFDYMAEALITEGLTELGLDPADIKYVIVSHGHGDHYLGAKYLQDTYGARIIMSEADWDVMAGDNNAPELKPTRDMIATDGMELTLGDTTLTLYVTPAHTPGTISTLIPLKDGNRWHLGSIWGGNGFGYRHFSERSEALATYSASAKRFHEITARARADVYLSSHTNHDRTLDKINAVKYRLPGDTHPFVSSEAVRRHLTVVGECADAQLAWLANAPD
jgi:metallo-beta-lactamase class B